MTKWLIIITIVCLGFVIVLLSLGYLLKENEAATKVLIQQLDQDKSINMDAESSTYSAKAVLTFVDNEKDKIEALNLYKSIIIKNVTCVNSKQCMLVNTKIPN